MKKLTLLLAMLVMAATMVRAQVAITKVDKISPTDEVFMDMAVTAASTAQQQGLKPCGAVVILNGAWRSTGLPAAGKTAEEAAIDKSRRTRLTNATIYTVNQPTSAAINAINRSGADAVYYVNPADDVIAAGVYTAGDYDPAAIDSSVPQVPVRQITYAPARKYVNK